MFIKKKIAIRDSADVPNTAHAQNKHWVGIALVLLAAMLWGTTGTVRALTLADAPSLAVGAMRMVIGGLALLALATLRRSDNQQTPAPSWAKRPLLGASACMAAYQLFFFAGVRLTGVAAGTVITIGSAPVLAGLLAWLLRGERPTARWWVATCMAVLGCILLGTAQSADAGALNPLGIVLALGAGASYALYAVFSKQLLAQHSAPAVAGWVFSIGALFLLPILFFQDVQWLTEPRSLLGAFILGLFATALAYTFFSEGLKRINIGTAVTLSLMEPVTAGILAVTLLHETLPLQGWLGVGLVFAGMIAVSSE
ncbi:MAG TPA: EamA family transporter [Anaerolineales bacterium]|nr:EamA family transporter [Anaerolineales bacterium]